MKTHSCTQESEFFFQIQLAYLFTWQMKLCARVDSFFLCFGVDVKKMFSGELILWDLVNLSQQICA